MSDLPVFGIQPATEPLAARDVREYFHESVAAALHHQKVAATEETVFYLVNLLAHFARADALFEDSDGGSGARPLALIYSDAVMARSRAERLQALKRLGDVALVIAGMFQASLNRKLVGVDYYIAMGGNAYDVVANGMSQAPGSRSPAQVFAELAAKFQRFVDVLTEVSDNSSLSASADILQWYEVWAKTGSPRAAEKLRGLGIEPALASFSPRHN
jgi:hypothetical protein